MKIYHALLVVLTACASEAPRIRNLAAAEALAQEVQAENLMPWVELLSEGHLRDEKLACDAFETITDYPSCELSHDSAINVVRNTFVELGYDTDTVVLGDEPYAAHNVVAEQLGTTSPSEVVLIAAHIDAFYAGADDNSSGVAAMLELARVVATHRFARTVRFVGFDLEERASRGSTWYVKAGYADDVVAALVLECVGYADHRKGSQDSPPGLPLGDVGDSLIIVANEDSASIAQRMLALNHALSLTTLRATIAGGSGAYFFSSALLRSDNGPFWLAGLPAVMLTDSANFRNPHYHKKTDTPETLDPAFLAASTRIVAAALAELAEVLP